MPEPITIHEDGLRRAVEVSAAEFTTGPIMEMEMAVGDGETRYLACDRENAARLASWLNAWLEETAPESPDQE